MKFSIFQESRIGKRKINQDRMNYSYTRDALLMVVADGMGGHLHGELAAQIAVQTISDTFKTLARTTLSDPFLFLSRTLSQSHLAINKHAGETGLADAPRTTCIVCIIQNNVAYWAHVGDSRLYLIRGGRVATRTRDHSRVQLLIDQGIITEAQAATHPERNKIYSCLGGYQPPDIEFSRKTPLEAGDVLALCTDGLWGVVPEETLIAGLQQENLIQAVPKLLNFADAHGGPNADNLSIVAVRWEDSYVDATSGLSSVISTQTMAPETVTTRLDAFGRNPKYKTELSEDEIERAIEEIRSTIQKFSK